MASLYRHPELAARMHKCGIVDRFVGAGFNTYEFVVSVRAFTSDQGFVGHALTLDLIDSEGRAVLSSLIAIYPHARLDDAEHDAELAARSMLVSLRTADPNVGWQYRYSPDGPCVAVASTIHDFKV